jgi:hypothetical protein
MASDTNQCAEPAEYRADGLDQSVVQLLRATWDSALGVLRHAENAMGDYDRDFYDPIMAEEERLFGEVTHKAGSNELKAWRASSGYNGICDASQRLSDAVGAAHTAMLMTPAPDLAALRWKLEQTIEPGDNGDIATWSDRIRLSIVADYQRLLPATSAGTSQLVCTSSIGT